MKHFATSRFHFLLLGLAIVFSSCGGNSETQAVEADSAVATAIPDSNQNRNTTLILIPNQLELEIPEALQERARKQRPEGDSVFYELAMGAEAMDLEFKFIKPSNDALSLEQMEEKRLFVGNDGKTYEYEGGQIFQSQWYTLPFSLEQKFKLTSYKDESDYAKMAELEEVAGNTKLNENETLSAYTSRYFLKLEQPVNGKLKQFILVLELVVGC